MSGIGIEPITSAEPITRAERMVAEDRLVEHVVDLVGGLVLVHRDLLDHDLALGVDLVLGVDRREEHLRHQVEGALGVLVEEARVDVRGLLARRRVERGADRVELLVELDRRVALRALEQQVLEEVRDAGLGGGLVARARPDPEPERDRAHRGHRLGDDSNAGLELGYTRGFSTDSGSDDASAG